MPLLYACAFLMDAASSAMVVSRSPFGMLLGATPFELGVLGSAATVPYAFSTLLFGRLSDRLGRRRLVLAGVACLTPLFALMPASKTPLQFGLLLATWSFVMGAYWPPLQAWIGDLRPAGLVGRALTWFNVGWSTGVMVGSLVGGLLFEAHPSWPFRFSLTCCVAIVGVVLLSPRPIAAVPQHSETPATNPLTQPQNGRLVYLGWLANAVSFFLSGTVYSLFPSLAAALVADGWFWAAIAATLAGSRTVGFLLVIRLEPWLYRPSALLATYGGLGVAMVTVVLTRALWPFFVAMALLGLCNAFSYSWSLLHSVENQSRKGATASCHESILRLGDFSGAFLAGASAQGWGLRAPYVLCTVMVGLGAAAQPLIARWPAGNRRAREE
jgi:DHA1 family multidrug resistance protein-like MFS transporter